MRQLFPEAAVTVFPTQCDFALCLEGQLGLLLCRAGLALCWGLTDRMWHMY